MKTFKSTVLFIFVMLSGFNGSLLPQIDLKLSSVETEPISMKITGLDKPVAIGKTIKAGIRFEVKEGYEINLIPLFEVTAKPVESGLEIFTEVLYDKDKLKEAKRRIAKGESVYLDHNKTHYFNMTIGGKPKMNIIHVNWETNLFYCSTIDGLCFKTTLNKVSTISIR